MTKEEKIEFLKKMGYGGSVLREATCVPPAPPKEARKIPAIKYNMDDLYHMHRIFNQKKEQICPPQTQD